MAKKIKLTLVDSTTPNELTVPPSSLGKAGASLWRSVMTEFEIEDSASVEMLLQACSAVDRIAEYSAAIDRDGPVIRTKNGAREHPLLKAELATRAFVVRALGRLGLTSEPIKPIGRPSGS